MVASVSGYCYAHSKEYYGVTKGDQLFPKLLNVAVGAVIRHWLILMEDEAMGMELFDCAVQCMVSFFYTAVMDTVGFRHPGGDI